MDRYFDPDRPKNYIYTSINNSLADKYLLRHVWKVGIRLIPKRMSANAVSILGSMFCWAAFIVLAGFPFGPLPLFAPRHPWVFGIVGILLFLYQTLDALDGIQARRIGSSGPLGEFVDHWFDSINAFMIPLGIALAFPAVPPVLAAVSVFLCGIADLLNGRSIVKRGLLEFGAFSSEEGLCLLYAFFVSVWALGYDFWASPSPVLGFAPVLIPFAVIPLAFLITGVSTFKYSADALGHFAIAVAILLPMLAWIVLDLPRDGGTALLVGSLALGGAGTRFGGDIMKVRLLGRVYSPYYLDLMAIDLILLASVLAPGLPAWAPLAAASASLAWIALALARQFAAMVGRVREMLGIGLFGPPRKPIPPKNLTAARSRG
jgi:phosphatidylglycerophosphate synthase